jgi:transposase
LDVTQLNGQMPLEDDTVRPYSEDIRIRVIQAYTNREGSLRSVARRFDVSLSFVRDLLRRFRETGSVAPKKYVGKSTSKLDQDSLQLILRLIDDNPALPLSHLCERLAQERQVTISRATMWRALQKHRRAKTGLSATPRKTSPASPQIER